MKTKVYIQNLKCEGCERTITSELNSIHGINVVSIDHQEDFVEFTQENDNLQLQVLSKLRTGYSPIIDRNGIRIKAKSIISCIKGQLQN